MEKDLISTTPHNIFHSHSLLPYAGISYPSDPYSFGKVESAYLLEKTKRLPALHPTDVGRVADAAIALKTQNFHPHDDSFSSGISVYLLYLILLNLVAAGFVTGGDYKEQSIVNISAAKMACASKLFTLQAGEVYARMPMKMDADPPLENTYKSLIFSKEKSKQKAPVVAEGDYSAESLPFIDLGGLQQGEAEMQRCKRDIAEASKEWGFFQVCNHGIGRELLEGIFKEQRTLFRRPFEKKNGECLFGFSSDSYRWGAPNATSLQQFSWSEAYHIPLAAVSGGLAEHGEGEQPHSLRKAIEDLSSAFSGLAKRLVEILAENFGHKPDYIVGNCSPNTCYLRLNRYPPRPLNLDVYGLVPHTDSDFLTILYQDQVGGLQLLKDGRWVTVKPNSEALVVNIGDLFQAWSNGLYKSVEHRVIAQSEQERLSVAYFMCPSYETVIQSCRQPSMYKQFSFKEYRQQIQEDVKTIGNKIGLRRFLNQ